MAKQAIYGYRLIVRKVSKHNPVYGDWVFVDDVADILNVLVTDHDGKTYAYGDYEAYHVDGWAKKEGVEVERCKFDFDPQRMTFTKSTEEGYV